MSTKHRCSKNPLACRAANPSGNNDTIEALMTNVEVQPDARMGFIEHNDDLLPVRILPGNIVAEKPLGWYVMLFTPEGRELKRLPRLERALRRAGLSEILKQS